LTEAEEQSAADIEEFVRIPRKQLEQWLFDVRALKQLVSEQESRPSPSPSG